MEVYSPVTDNAYEYRSDVTSTVVNKRRNQQNLQRSIQAHKNRLAMARIKKGKNLPTDVIVKNDNAGYCRQSTADTNENYQPSGFKRHTQSSLNKISKPVFNYNSISSSNSFEGKFDGEKIYIKKYEDFDTKINQSMVQYNSNMMPKLSNDTDFSFDPNFHSNKVELDSEELEKKVIEILGRLLLKKESTQQSKALPPEVKEWYQKQNQGQAVVSERNTSANNDQVVELLTKCISTTLNSATNDNYGNISSSRTSKSVNVEINLNMPPSKAPEQPVTMNVSNSVEDIGDVFIENVFNRDTKIVEGNIFKRAYDKVKCLYLPEKKSDLKQPTKRWNTVTVRPNLAGFDHNQHEVFFKTKQAHSAWIQAQNWKNFQNKPAPSDLQWNQRTMTHPKVMNCTNPCGSIGNGHKCKVNVKPTQTIVNSQNEPKPANKLERTKSFSEVGTIFRPFSRCRSQTANLQHQKQTNGNVMAVKNIPVQNTESFMRSNTCGPVKMGTTRSNFNNVESNRAPKPNDFNNHQIQDVGVDLSFDPFNLKQKFNPQNAQNNNQVGQAWKNDRPASVWNEKQTTNLQNHNARNTPMLKRNNSFNFFGRKNTGLKRGNQEFMASYNANFTERFEKNGINCLNQFGQLRQTTMPKLMMQNTNVNKFNQQNLMNSRIQQVPRVGGAPQTPNTFSKIKRTNTDPKVLNKFQSGSDNFVNHKQFTADLSFKANQPKTKLKLLESKRVINTLNTLSRLNTIF